MINKLLKALKFEKSNFIKLTVSHKNAKKIKIVRPLKFSKAGSKLVKEQKSKKSNSIKKNIVFKLACKIIQLGPKRCLKLAGRLLKEQNYKKKIHKTYDFALVYKNII
jgi:hypothetical protein